MEKQKIYVVLWGDAHDFGLCKAFTSYEEAVTYKNERKEAAELDWDDVNFFIETTYLQ